MATISALAATSSPSKSARAELRRYRICKRKNSARISAEPAKAPVAPFVVSGKATGPSEGLHLDLGSDCPGRNPNHEVEQSFHPRHCALIEGTRHWRSLPRFSSSGNGADCCPDAGAGLIARGGVPPPQTAWRSASSSGLSDLRASALQDGFPVGGNVVAGGPKLPGCHRF
jgi:hypothetical protein